MKKLFLTLVAAVIGATAATAQTSLLATLSHDGEITAYYGSNALREAHEAAVSGDVITLSSGSFNATGITKAITLRGAGMAAKRVADPTVVAGELSINIPSEDTGMLTVEGLHFNKEIYIRGIISAPKFIKCSFYELGDDGGYFVNATFFQCRIRNYSSIGDNATISFVNSYLRCDKVSGTEFVNCILRVDKLVYSENNSYKSCIFYEEYGEGLNSSCTATNCIGLYKQGNQDYFENITNSSNTSIQDDGSGIFKTFTYTSSYSNDWSDDETFELTDEAAATYLGADGTQVGIYGGTMPFDPTPTNPQITKAAVAAKTTADGKLSIDIEVKAAE